MAIPGGSDFSSDNNRLHCPLGTGRPVEKIAKKRGLSNGDFGASFDPAELTITYRVPAALIAQVLLRFTAFLSDRERDFLRVIYRYRCQADGLCDLSPKQAAWMAGIFEGLGMRGPA